MTFCVTILVYWNPIFSMSSLENHKSQLRVNSKTELNTLSYRNGFRIYLRVYVFMFTSEYLALLLQTFLKRILYSTHFSV